MKSNWAFLVVILVGIIVMLSVLAGCAQQGANTESPKAPAPAPAKQEAQIIRWGSSSVGSTGYTLSVKMIDMVNKYTKFQANLTPVGGSEATIRAITRLDRDMGTATTDAAWNGYQGIGAFAKEGKQPIMLVAMVYPSTLAFLAQPGITSVPEFKGKTVSYRRTPAPLFGVFGDSTLKAYGLDPDKDVKNVSTLELREITDALKTATIDVGMIPGAVPGSVIPELLQAKPFNIIDLGKDKTEVVSKENPFITPYLIKGGTFKGQSKDIWVMGFTNTIIARNDIPENVVYEVTKAIYSHLEDLVGVDPVAKTITIQDAPKNPVIPLHPGAIKYYKEVGVLK